MANRRNYDFTLNGKQTSWNYVTNNPVTTTVTSTRRGIRDATDYSRRKPGPGWVPPTNYSLLAFKFTSPHGTLDTTSSGPPQYGLIRSLTGAIGGWSHASTQMCIDLRGSYPSDLANRALIKARVKLKSSDINLGLAFGERRQTARLVASNLVRVANMFRELRRSTPDKLVRDIPQLWLELKYGWEPLLSDIFGAVSALDKRDRSDWAVTVKASASSRKKIAYQTPPNLEYDNRYRIDGEVMFGSYVRIDAVPAADSLRTAASLGLTNPLSLSWELLPFSFVVDWAYPLGSYFDSLDALVGWEVKGFSQSNLTRSRMRTMGVSGPVAGQPWYDRADWHGRYDYTLLQRTVGTSVPFPMLPSIKDPISQVHVANALALLASVFRGSSTVR